MSKAGLEATLTTASSENTLIDSESNTIITSDDEEMGTYSRGSAKLSCVLTPIEE